MTEPIISSSEHCRNPDQVEYRDIPGWPEYRAGTDGSIWSRRCPNGSGLNEQWRQLTGSPRKSGHVFVGIIHAGKARNRPIHQLILEAFVGPRPAGMQARHFPDRNPSNNRINNLSWATPLENQQDRLAHGTRSAGAKHGLSKLTDDNVAQIRDLASQGLKHREIGLKFGISRQQVSKIVSGVRWARQP